MHDTLDYFSRDPIHRVHHHDELTFGLLYAFTENFILPLSHDEVVHGKGSLLSKMPGDRWQQLANLRALYAYMWAHPGKKLLFMGGELAQEQEWSHERSLDWHLLERAGPCGRPGARARPEPALPGRARALGARLRARPASAGSRRTTARANVLAFARLAADGSPLVCAGNFSPRRPRALPGRPAARGRAGASS